MTPNEDDRSTLDEAAAAAAVSKYCRRRRLTRDTASSDRRLPCDAVDLQDALRAHLPHRTLF